MIYIQSDNDKKIPHHFDVACAMYGAIDNGIDYKLVTFDEVKSGKYDNVLKTNMFVGSVEFLTEVFNRIGKSPRVPQNSNRKEDILTLREAKQRVINGEKLFIKPKQIKLFTGMVVDEYFLSCLNPYPDETEVIVSKPFDKEILSEWRCYIHMGKVVDIRNYSGDIFILPSKEYIEDVIKQYDNFPISYTVDVGILDGGENVVIEFNDMWAIGNYGIDNTLYFRLLRQRYFDIIRN